MFVRSLTIILPSVVHRSLIFMFLVEACRYWWTPGRLETACCCLSDALALPNYAVVPCGSARRPTVRLTALRCPCNGRDDENVSIKSEDPIRHCFVDKPGNLFVGAVLCGLGHALCSQVRPSTVLTLTIRISLKFLHPFPEYFIDAAFFSKYVAVVLTCRSVSLSFQPVHVGDYSFSRAPGRRSTRQLIVSLVRRHRTSFAALQACFEEGRSCFIARVNTHWNANNFVPPLDSLSRYPINPTHLR